MDAEQVTNEHNVLNCLKIDIRLLDFTYFCKVNVSSTIN